MDYTFFINRELDTPLYQQLYQLIKKDLEEGHIQKGMRLPSKRLLATKLSISQATVERAYEQLAAEGYIVSKPRSGWFADYDETDSIHHEAENASLMSVAKEKEHWIDFHYGNVDGAHFPFSAWRKCMVGSLDQYGQQLHRPGDARGELELRTLIAEHLYHARGVECLPEQVILGAGSPVLLQILCQILGKDRYVGYEDPGYERSRKIFCLNGMRILPISVDEEGISMTDIHKKHPSLLYVTPSHQFPLGTVMTINRRRELLKWAADHQAFIIEDDYDGEYRYSGQPIPSLQGLDEHGRVIYLGTFSKSLLPSLRISYIILPPSLVEKGREITSLYKQTVSCHIQLALVEFIKKGEWQRHINRMRKLYQRKREMLLETIQSEMGDQVKIRGGDTGLHILLEVDSCLNERELIETAIKQGVKIYPASPFYTKQPPGNTVFIGFAGINDEEIRAGIKKLKAAWLK